MSLEIILRMTLDFFHPSRRDLDEADDSSVRVHLDQIAIFENLRCQIRAHHARYFKLAADYGRVAG